MCNVSICMNVHLVRGEASGSESGIPDWSSARGRGAGFGVWEQAAARIDDHELGPGAVGLGGGRRQALSPSSEREDHADLPGGRGGSGAERSGACGWLPLTKSTLL